MHSCPALEAAQASTACYVPGSSRGGEGAQVACIQPCLPLVSPSAAQHDHQQYQAVVAVAECMPGANRAECKQQKWFLEEAGWACWEPRNDIFHHGF